MMNLSTNISNTAENGSRQMRYKNRVVISLLNQKGASTKAKTDVPRENFRN